MIKNYFKIAIRSLLKNKLFSFVNIFGFSIGLASAILIITFIWHELSYDKYHPDYNNIYRVYCDQPNNLFLNSTKFNVMPIPFQPEIKQRYPEVEFAARLAQMSGLYNADDKNYISEYAYAVDPDFFEIFYMDVLYGSIKNALDDATSIVISESFSKKLFGDINPVGKTIQLNESFSMVVKAVFKNLPSNTHFSTNVFLPLDIQLKRVSEESKTNWSSHSVKTYIKLKKGTDPDNFEAKLKELIVEKREEGIKDSYHLQPIKDIHLYGKLNFEITSNGDIKYILIFGAIALFILLIASFNYMNLSTARSMKRAKEVGLRKVVGASQKQLFRQFIGESLFFIFFSLLISLVLIEIFEPYFNDFVNREIHFYNFPFQFYVLILGVFLFISFVSGSYPALYLSHFSPIKVLKSDVKGSMKTVLVRNILVVIQFFISVVLIICTLVVILQLVYIKNKDLGFDTENVLSVSLNSKELMEKKQVLANELLKCPNILDVTFSNYLPSKIRSSSGITFIVRGEKKVLKPYVLETAENFLGLYNIELIKGVYFSKETKGQNYAVINQAAAIGLDVENLEDVNFSYGYPKRNTYKIIGIVDDFHFAPLNQAIQPLIIFQEKYEAEKMSVKISKNNHEKTLKYIEKNVKSISEKHPFVYSFIKNSIDKSYAEEQRLSSLFTFFTIIAVVIACMGLFGLISFITDQRTKEIGIRKVLGASVQSIIMMLSKNITKWILLANVIAWPVAWYFMDRWLQNFQYHIKLDVLIFALVGILSLLIGLLTVGVQAIKAALLNPVETLKYE